MPRSFLLSLESGLLDWVKECSCGRLDDESAPTLGRRSGVCRSRLSFVEEMQLRALIPRRRLWVEGILSSRGTEESGVETRLGVVGGIESSSLSAGSRGGLSLGVLGRLSSRRTGGSGDETRLGVVRGIESSSLPAGSRGGLSIGKLGGLSSRGTEESGDETSLGLVCGIESKFPPARCRGGLSTGESGTSHISISCAFASVPVAVVGTGVSNPESSSESGTSPSSLQFGMADYSHILSNL